MTLHPERVGRAKLDLAPVGVQDQPSEGLVKIRCWPEQAAVREPVESLNDHALILKYASNYLDYTAIYLREASGS